MKPDTLRINVKDKASFVIACNIEDVQYDTEKTHVRVGIDSSQIQNLINSLYVIKNQESKRNADRIEALLLELRDLGVKMHHYEIT